jgi:hypothetical protein
MSHRYCITPLRQVVWYRFEKRRDDERDDEKDAIDLSSNRHVLYCTRWAFNIVRYSTSFEIDGGLERWLGRRGAF